jgi:hypothetical protein
VSVRTVTSAPASPAEHDLPPGREQFHTEQSVACNSPCRLGLIDPGTGAVITLRAELLACSPSRAWFLVRATVPAGMWAEALTLRSSGEPILLNGTVIHCRPAAAGTFELGVEVCPPQLVT